jgi:crystallin, alpha B
MAFLPVILDLVDEMYTSLDDQSKTFSDRIPFFIIPQRNADGQDMGCRRGPMMRGCQMQKPDGCPRKCRRGTCAVAKPASDDFELSIDVQTFKPEEITVKVKNNEIIVEGKHEERQDEFGFVSRQFSRRCTLPQEFDPDTISTFLNAEGKMTIKAQKPQPPAVETNERVIPIQREPKAAATEATTEQEWEKVDEAVGETSKKPDEEPKE